eukprot:3002021-Rhodomonas_salina.1
MSARVGVTRAWGTQTAPTRWGRIRVRARLGSVETGCRVRTLTSALVDGRGRGSRRRRVGHRGGALQRAVHRARVEDHAYTGKHCDGCRRDPSKAAQITAAVTVPIFASSVLGASVTWQQPDSARPRLFESAPMSRASPPAARLSRA